MNAIEVIKQVEEECAEWLEMSEDPATFVAGVLANKVLKLQSEIEYLERRLDHAIRPNISRVYPGNS